MSDITPSEFKILCEKISAKTASKSETAQYNAYYEYFQSNQKDLKKTAEEWTVIKEDIYKKVFSSIKQPNKKASVIKLWMKLSAAAIIVLGIAILLFIQKDAFKQNFQTVENTKTQKQKPEKSTLTLSNGHKVVLSDIKVGQVAKQGGVRITKSKTGELIYLPSTGLNLDNGELEKLFNTTSTVRGNTVQLTLPDGTKVWLNAATSLTYPLKFSKENRTVKLDGEAYFEVTKNKNQPFIVETSKQKVQVLGTHFNIDAYSDDAETKTTLLEGAVKVYNVNGAKEPVTLHPGEQSRVNGTVSVLTVNTDDAIAWKNDVFVFNDETLESIMKNIARWYDVDIVYRKKPEEDFFMGRISRKRKLPQVLNALSKTAKVNFKLEGKKLIIL